MATPASSLLRPLTLAEILDQAIRLYRNNFTKFIGILAIPYIPLIVLQTAMSFVMTSSLYDSMLNPTGDSLSEMFGLGYWLGMLGTIVGVILQFVLIQGVATAALTRAVADNYTGKTVGIFDSYRNVGGSWLRLLLALLAVSLISFVLFIWMIVPCVGWFTGPGIFLFLAMVVIPLIAPVIVLERHGALTSIRRAWNLSRGRFWWLIGFAFILYLFSQLVITGPTMLASLVIQAVLPAGTAPFGQANVLSTVIQSLVTMIFSLLYLPLQLTAITVVYFDLRIRSEGLDLAMQSSETTSGGNNVVFLPEITAPPQNSLITGTEIGYFALLTVGGVAIYFLIVGVIMGLFLAISPL